MISCLRLQRESPARLSAKSRSCSTPYLSPATTIFSSTLLHHYRVLLLVQTSSVYRSESNTDETAVLACSSPPQDISVDCTGNVIQVVIGGFQGLRTTSRALSAFGGFFSAHPHSNISSLTLYFSVINTTQDPSLLGSVVLVAGLKRFFGSHPASLPPAPPSP